MLDGSHFFPKELQQDALKNLKTCHRTSYEHEGITVNAVFATPGASTKTVERFTKILHWMNFVMTLLKSWTVKFDKTQLTVVLLDMDAPRRVPGSSSKFRLNDPRSAAMPSPLHVNGGVTYFRQDHVFVFRREDMLKVLIHELIHFFDLDYKWGLGGDQAVLGTMLMTNSVNANEAFVESLAIAIHVCVFCIATGVKREKVLDVFEQEMQYLLQQALCITVIYIHSIKKTGGRTLIEKSSASAYYVLKTALLMNDKYWTFLEKNRYNIGEVGRFREFVRVCEESIVSGSEFWKALESMYKTSGTCTVGASLSMTSLDVLDDTL